VTPTDRRSKRPRPSWGTDTEVLILASLWLCRSARLLTPHKHTCCCSQDRSLHAIAPDISVFIAVFHVEGGPVALLARVSFIYLRGICCRRVSVCLSVSVCVCPSHTGIAYRRLNLGPRKQRHTIAQGLCCQSSRQNSNGSPPTGAPDAGGVG